MDVEKDDKDERLKDSASTFDETNRPSAALESEATHDSEAPTHMDMLLNERNDRNQKEFVQSRDSID